MRGHPFARRKAKCSVSPENVRFINPHTFKGQRPPKNRITVMTIDPGTKNCAIRAVTKTVTENTSTKELVFFDLIHPGKRGDCLYDCVIQTIEELKAMESTLVMCDYIVIEKQLVQNTDLIRQMQNLETAIMMITKDKGNQPIIVEVDARIKSIAFEKCAAEYERESTQAKRNRQTKLKSIDAAPVILREDNDEYSLRMISFSTKKDDLSDVCCWEYAWWKCMDTLENLPLAFAR